MAGFLQYMLGKYFKYKRHWEENAVVLTRILDWNGYLGLKLPCLLIHFEAERLHWISLEWIHGGAWQFKIESHNLCRKFI